MSLACRTHEEMDMAPGHRPLGKNPHLENACTAWLPMGKMVRTRDVHAWDGGPEPSRKREPKHGMGAQTRSEAEGKNKG